MNIVKKVSIVPFFLVVLALLIYQFKPLLTSYETVFSLSWNALMQLIILAVLILSASLMFSLFAFLAEDWRLILAVVAVASLIPLLLVTLPLGLILAVGILTSLLLTYLTLENKLKNYLTFEPNSLLGPAIRHLATLLVIVICLSYFLSINKLIQQEGFQIPDSLIDTALKIAVPPQTETTDQPEQAVQPQLTQDLIKQTVKDQLQTLLKPYLGFIPAALAVILFLTLQSLTSILNLLIHPLLWLTFYILEKTGFVKFTEEMRPVKKIVI